MLITFSTLSVSGQAKGNKSVHKSDRVINKHALVAELVDALVLEASVFVTCGFESHRVYDMIEWRKQDATN